MYQETLTAGRARERLSYNSDTGILTWRTARIARDVGREAGYVRHDGYRAVEVDGRKYLSHRLVWLIVYGSWPADLIDHINGDGGDNRLHNLRLATSAENNQNTRKAHANSSHGFLGTTLHKRSGLWCAKITVKGKRISLGYYKTPELAMAAHIEAKRQLHPFCTI